MVGEKEGVGFGVELQNAVVSEILKLWGALVEPLEDANATILVFEESFEPVRAEEKRVLILMSS